MCECVCVSVFVRFPSSHLFAQSDILQLRMKSQTLQSIKSCLLCCMITILSITSNNVMILIPYSLIVPITDL